jgi:hypothetical protein
MVERFRPARPAFPATFMANITRELLDAYLDDALNDTETAKVESALRESEPLRRLLRTLIQERDRGEHSIGAIWRRQRLTCPGRDQLGSYLLEALDGEEREYVDFHLHTIGCSFCLANLTDLQARQKEPAPKANERRRRYFESSAGYLQMCRDTKK